MWFQINSTSETCPEAISISYSNLTISDPTYPYTVFSYSISYLDDSWKFDYNGKNRLYFLDLLDLHNSISVTRTCPPDWTLYNRPLSDYCLKLFGNPNATYNQQQATDFCDTQNATLAGLESYDEKYAMTCESVGENIVFQRCNIQGYFWWWYYFVSIQSSSLKIRKPNSSTRPCNQLARPTWTTIFRILGVRDTKIIMFNTGRSEDNSMQWD